jgi:hypothetical protein
MRGPNGVCGGWVLCKTNRIKLQNLDEVDATTKSSESRTADVHTKASDLETQPRNSSSPICPTTLVDRVGDSSRRNVGLSPTRVRAATARGAARIRGLL